MRTAIARHHQHKTARRWLLAAMCCALLQPAEPASAHSWYPPWCCNDQDCFRATKIKRLPDGELEIEAGHITVRIPSGFEIQPSKDGDAHVCVYRDIRGHYQPRCVFLPGVS